MAAPPLWRMFRVGRACSRAGAAPSRFAAALRPSPAAPLGPTHATTARMAASHALGDRAPKDPHAKYAFFDDELPPLKPRGVAMQFIAPVVNAVLGTWLVTTAWWLPHTRPQQEARLLVGTLITYLAPVAAAFPPVRFAIVVIMATFLGHIVNGRPTTTTEIHDAIVVATMIAFALLPTRRDERSARARLRQAHAPA
jgi:hypothetical protein